MTAAPWLLFPMAGAGLRFGGGFKPFREFDGELFIEAAVRPFRRHLPHLAGVAFVYLAEQEQEYDVSRRLGERLAPLHFEAVTLPEPTSGPVETLRHGLFRLGIDGPFISCDCDHSVDVDPLFRRLASEPVPDVVVPVWPLDGEDVAAWSVVALDGAGTVRAIAEKRPPNDAAASHMGVIGCYYFSSAREFTRKSSESTSVSDVIGEMLADGQRVESVRIRDAEFFGDPSRLEAALERRRRN